MPAATIDPYKAQRTEMVEGQIRARGVSDERVLAAVRTVPRHRFLPQALFDRAYSDAAVPLGPGQSISQPYIVARMTELAQVAGRARVLEIGTGSGYQAAVLAELAGTVYTIEIDETLATRAAQTLADLHYRNVQVRAGDGRLGWPEAAPFDAILVTAAADRAPPALMTQLASGGRLILPINTGPDQQQLRVIERHADGTFGSESVGPVRFVPLVS